MAVKKSIAIIGEGETEWWHFDTLRIVCRYKFKDTSVLDSDFRGK